MMTDWLSLTDTDVERESWSECLALLNDSGGENVMFRGHGCFQWALESTLERDLLELTRKTDQDRYGLLQSMAADPETEQWALDQEKAITDYFRENASHFGIPSLPPREDELAWWELMQHHGAPTRLMDWSRSPLIAVWFALDSHIEGSDMAIWVYAQRTSDANHAESRSALAQTPGFHDLDRRSRQGALVRLAIWDGNPALIPIDPCPFQRATAQQSVLTVSPSIGVARPAHWWIRQRLATRVRLREAWKSEMVALCRESGLSRAALFRDLDSLGSHITSHFRSGEALSGLL